MAGGREPVARDPKFQESVSGKPSPGTGYTYNALKGDYEYRGLPGLGTYAPKESFWKQIEKAWQVLFGKKNQEPVVSTYQEPKPLTPEERQRVDAMLAEEGEALRRKRLGLGGNQ